MKTLTLTLEPDLEQRLAALAQLGQRSESEIALEAIKAFTAPSIQEWFSTGNDSDL